MPDIGSSDGWRRESSSRSRSTGAHIKRQTLGLVCDKLIKIQRFKHTLTEKIVHNNKAIFKFHTKDLPIVFVPEKIGFVSIKNPQIWT